MKTLVLILVCYALIGAGTVAGTVAAAGYREGFKQLYRNDMMTPADMLGIFAAWPLVWIGFSGMVAYTGLVTLLDKAVRRPAQKIGEAHKVEWDSRQSAIREVERLLTDGKR